MISFTTRNRPHVLEYSLKKTREVYDGFIVVIDDNSDKKEFNQEICKRYDAKWLYNDVRKGIPGSKERGFRSLLSFDFQYWFDDDCYPKEGWLERMSDAQQYQSHLLHLQEWSHIREKKELVNGFYKELPGDLIAYTGATACFMSFRKDQYEQVKGFHIDHGIYGGWHHTLSQKLAELDEYVAVENSSDYIHSFDVDGVPSDFDYMFQSSLPQHERIKK
jgi:GT2 family glycosyltransferase